MKPHLQKSNHQSLTTPPWPSCLLCTCVFQKLLSVSSGINVKTDNCNVISHSELYWRSLGTSVSTVIRVAMVVGQMKEQNINYHIFLLFYYATAFLVIPLSFAQQVISTIPLSGTCTQSFQTVHHLLVFRCDNGFPKGPRLQS